MDGKGWEKRTFSEEIVKFQPTDGKAEMQIHKKRIIEPSTADKILFFKGALVLYDEFVESVVISVPEESEIGETADTTQICTDCGAEILKKFQYCSGCGKKLE